MPDRMPFRQINEVGGRGRQTPPALWKDCGLCRLGCVGETSPSHEKTPVIPSFREKTSGIPAEKSTDSPLRDASAHTPAIIHNEEAPLCWDPLPCNSTALAPQGFRPTFATYLLRSTLPMADFRPHSLRCFGRILALTVPSAVGFSPKFLQNCRLTQSVFTACSHTTSPDPINLFFLFSFGNQRIRNASRAANQPFVLSAISIKRRLSVVNSHLQNSSFLSQTPSDHWGTNGGAMAFSLFRRTAIRKTALGRVRFSGACGRIRTGDLLITSELLCQLSHTSIFMRLTLKAKWYLTTNPPSRQLLFLCWATCFVGKYTV